MDRKAGQTQCRFAPANLAMSDSPVDTVCKVMMLFRERQYLRMFASPSSLVLSEVVTSHLHKRKWAPGYCVTLDAYEGTAQYCQFLRVGPQQNRIGFKARPAQVFPLPVALRHIRKAEHGDHPPGHDALWVWLSHLINILLWMKFWASFLNWNDLSA